MTPLDLRFSRVSAEITEDTVGLGSRLVEHPIVLCLAGGLTPQAVLAPAYFAGELHGVTARGPFSPGWVTCGGALAWRAEAGSRRRMS